MVWEPGEEAWENKLATLRSYRRATGHLAPRQNAMWDDPDGQPIAIGQLIANLRRPHGLGKKDAKTAATRAEQLTAIDADWNCSWALDWQRHYRVLAKLAADEPDSRLPDIAPGVHLDGDDLGRWLQRQKQPGTWKQLSTEQQERLARLGVTPLEAPSPAPALAGRGKAKRPSKTQQAFQRGLTALAQWVEREGRRPVPRKAVVEIAVDGEPEPVPVRLGVWITNTKTRRDKLSQEQLAALQELGIEWA